jgi:hypothetical protein
MYKNKVRKKKLSEYLFESMYRYHLAHDGGKLEEGYEISIAAYEIQKFIGDRIRRSDQSWIKWRASHGKEFKS